MTGPPASVIVRTRDAAATVERVFRALRAQTVESEILVVDSGSTDGTLDVARRWCDRLLTLSPSDFSFGRALNVGAAAARAPVHFALSAHCWPERTDWIERSLRHYERADVAGTTGARLRWDRQPLLEPAFQTAEAARAYPYWGFSNHASSWRAEVWHELPFDEEMEACEDKEWAWRALKGGRVIVLDPLLWVSVEHRKADGPLGLYRRMRREARALSAKAPLPPFTVKDALRFWWSDRSPDARLPPLLHRLNHFRMAEIAGRYVGEREGRNRRQP